MRVTGQVRYNDRSLWCIRGTQLDYAIEQRLARWTRTPALLSSIPGGYVPHARGSQSLPSLRSRQIG